MSIPAGSPVHRHHAIHHVIGRIRHRPRPHPVHAVHKAPPPNFEGCETHTATGITHAKGKTATTLLRTAPAGPLLAAVSWAGGAAVGGIGGYVAGRTTKEHKSASDHKPGSTPIPEPSSAVVLMSAVLIGLAARRWGGRES